MAQKKLPESGMAQDALFAALTDMKKNDMQYQDGRTFSLIYNAGQDVIEIGRRAFAMYLVENGLSPFSFPSLKTMETEVISMVASLLNGGDGAVGNMTTGGTESILMAVKAARDRAHKKHPQITQPELIKAATTHPAFNKAAHYLGLKVVTAPVDKDFRMDADAVRDAITDNTIFICASAFTYPHGVVDPIEDISALAAERGIWFHTDACLGGFILPFVEQLGYDVPVFDFRAPGVTSMSCDLHKYGYCPKGASSVLYRNAADRLHQYYAFADFPGGVYGTPTMCGGRTGGPYAGAWAVMHYLGHDGYLRLAKQAMDTARKLQDGVRAIPGLDVLGAPHGTVFAMVGDNNHNIYAVSDFMTESGWFLEKQQMPASLHVTTSPYHAEVADQFLADLALAAKKAEGMDGSKLSQEAAMYGMMATMPDRALARDLALQFLNDLYKLESK
jgi:glutamate/tyrosine decarboxylase-like PLP-dependent enzyme